MTLFEPADRAFIEAAEALAYANPFLPERINYERQALGDAFAEAGAVWSSQPGHTGERPNVVLIEARVEQVCAGARAAIAAGTKVNAHERDLYVDLASYLLYYRTWKNFEAILGAASKPRDQAAAYVEFVEAWEYFLDLPGIRPGGPFEPGHLFALFFQIRRAFRQIFTLLLGSSLAIAKLRAAVWQSLFTHDLRRYHHGLYAHMTDVPTLITGASGTGKELVARAIALARYVPWDAKLRRFACNPGEMFFPLNLSALSPMLIESELFGHKRGAYTGALEDRQGWLELCPPTGTVFLDEIGELDPLLQVKLLRVLQQRTFQRLGEAQTRRFEGKIIAATNRDLPAEMDERRFRKDFFYRLNADHIHAPTLAEQLAGSPEELPRLVGFVARRVAAEQGEALARDVVEWVETELGADYPWPGNFRELEQCVRNVMIRKEYRPPRRAKEIPSVHGELAEEFTLGKITADVLLRRYCTLVYAQTGSYEETARRLLIDRRTVKAKVDGGLLEQLRAARQ